MHGMVSRGIPTSLTAVLAGQIVRGEDHPCYWYTELRIDAVIRHDAVCCRYCRESLGSTLTTLINITRPESAVED